MIRLTTAGLLDSINRPDHVNTQLLWLLATMILYLVERRQNITTNLSLQQILQDLCRFVEMTAKLKDTPKDAYQK